MLRKLFIAVIVYILVFLTYTFINHYTFGTQAYDTGIYLQSLWTTANGEGFFYNTPEAQGLGWELPSNSHFGVHFQPILLLLVPIYKLAPWAETLFALHTLALALASIPLYNLAYAILGDRKRALIISLLYLINPGIHGINRYDFHPVSFAIPFIFLLMYHWEIRNYKMAFLSSIPILLVKEDAGLILISIGAFYILKDLNLEELRHPSRIITEKQKEVILILIGVLWIVFSIFLAIPYFGSHGYSYKFYSLKIHFPKLAIKLILIHFMSLAFLPLIKPRLLISTLPLWAELVFSPMYGMLKIGYHYPYMLVPMLLLISIYSLKEYEINLRLVVLITFTAFLLFSPIVNLSNVDCVAGARFSSVIMRVATNYEFYKSLHQEIDKYKYFDGKLVVQDHVFPHLANNPNVYLLRGKNIKNADLILVCPRFRDIYSQFYLPKLENYSNVVFICR